MGFLVHDLNTRPRPRCLDPTARITVMGEHGSGKTSLIIRWLKDRFEPLEQGLYDIYTLQVSKSTIQNFDDPDNEKSLAASETDELLHQNNSELAPLVMNRANSYGNRTTVNAQILDTSPIEIGEFSELRSIQIEQSDAFILCFDCTTPTALDDLRLYKRTIDAVKSDPLILICCTKTDLSTERLYGIDEITDLLNKLDIPPSRYFEVSAKHGTNTDQLICRTLAQIEREKLGQRNSAVKVNRETSEQYAKARSHSTASISIEEKPLVKKTTTVKRPKSKHQKSHQCCVIA
ncbi:hypothetical protein RNJ44_02965 [Nakaseomyces bracarensis]|uniref:Uncharacterized protein n=1 Tax=Nakaseomyces bracarensis TaxID=273131 RepID=A0ABR4P0R1_9SACH